MTLEATMAQSAVTAARPHPEAPVTRPYPATPARPRLPRSPVALQASVAQLCTDLAAATSPHETDRRIGRLHDTVERWARAGVPIDAVHHAVHGVFAELLCAPTYPGEPSFGRAAADLDLLCRVTRVVSGAYLAEGPDADGQRDARLLAAALIDGDRPAAVARERGIRLDSAYHVLAVDIPFQHDRRSARARLRLLHLTLTKSCAAEPLSLLGPDGGTLLLPASAITAEGVTDLLGELTLAAAAGLTAAVVEAPFEEVGPAAGHVDELLDIALRLDRPARLYRLTDLALEYQLTRPGPARDHLAGLITPLAAHPELLETLAGYLHHNLNRRRTADQLHIHPNTIDYRLKRIQSVTGVDPADVSGLWLLASGLLVHRFLTTPPNPARQP
ncbi:PucR family transcriptional regulator [Nocardia sp. alder85J]|uniref:PucR family transcriptional regulator n=1 Tax=Nocardia sp. alder85J TaxID=2862949 RepID=UPI001CD30369|nr:helix-turn-helix domain-containing protein [Nocardia sp. alder85J]MCX4091338.1 helix-turn-helix domain-containing protein [Nocardia sp. alder85J]